MEGGRKPTKTLFSLRFKDLAEIRRETLGLGLQDIHQNDIWQDATPFNEAHGVFMLLGPT
jgi:hypothetical protein